MHWNEALFHMIYTIYVIKWNSWLQVRQKDEESERGRVWIKYFKSTVSHYGCQVPRTVKKYTGTSSILTKSDFKFHSVSRVEFAREKTIWGVKEAQWKGKWKCHHERWQELCYLGQCQRWRWKRKGQLTCPSGSINEPIEQIIKWASERSQVNLLLVLEE